MKLNFFAEDFRFQGFFKKFCSQTDLLFSLNERKKFRNVVGSVQEFRIGPIKEFFFSHY